MAVDVKVTSVGFFKNNGCRSCKHFVDERKISSNNLDTGSAAIGSANKSET